MQILQKRKGKKHSSISYEEMKREMETKEGLIVRNGNFRLDMDAKKKNEYSW